MKIQTINRHWFAAKDDKKHYQFASVFRKFRPEDYLKTFGANEKVLAFKRLELEYDLEQMKGGKE